jgi:hypothetical protein
MLRSAPPNCSISVMTMGREPGTGEGIVFAGRAKSDYQIVV